MIYRILRGILLKIIFPILMGVGAFVKSRKEGLQRWVVSANNALVMKEGVRSRKLLVLLPHCLQTDQCEIRLTHNVRNCKLCGRCGIKDLIGIVDRFGLDLHVATGGNLARRIVIDLKPQAIVAVACERDLSSGIADTYPVAVLGVPNERPCGPCINTRVDLALVEQAIVRLMGGGS